MSKVNTLIEYAKFGVEMSRYFCQEQISLNLPKNVKKYYPYLTGNNDSITEVYGPNVLEMEAGEVFKGFGNLMKISFPNLIALNDNNFKNLSKLKEVYIPSTISIGSKAFDNCISLKKLDLPSVISIGSEFLKYSGVEVVNLPAITSIGMNVFNNATNLKEINITSMNHLSNCGFINNCPNIQIIRFGRITGSISATYFESDNIIEYVGIGEQSMGTIQLYKSPNLTQECLHQIIDNYMDMTGLTSPMLWIGEVNIAKISPEYIEKLNQKNIDYQ